jgi:DNA topoisomerase-1
LKQEADANRTITDFGADGIQVLNGRYGPYVTDGKKNAKIPKDRDPKTLTLEECRVLIEQAPARGTGRFGRGKRGASAGKAGSRAAAGGNGKAAANGTDGGVTTGEKAGKAKRPRPSAPATAGANLKSATASPKKSAASTPSAAKKAAAKKSGAARTAAPGKAAAGTIASTPSTKAGPKPPATRPRGEK